MKAFKLAKFRLRGWKLWTTLAVVIVLALAAVWQLRSSYERSLEPVSSSTTTQYFTVESGETSHQIAINLQSAGLIRSSSAFEEYVRINELRSQLEAGTYNLSPSMSTQTIAKMVASGDIVKNLVTILPGTRLTQIQQTLIRAGYSKDKAAAALQRKNYSSNSLMADIPAGRSLEGFLYPDSYQKNIGTPASVLINKSLTEMANHLTPSIVAGFKKQGLSIYQGVTLASIVEQESGDPADSPKIAQVFLSRLHIDMSLGSDVTARYASILAGVPFDPGINSPYNTRVVGGLPPGPIGTVTSTSLEAVANPASTSYLYFVTGDNGITYFSHTEAQHEALVQKYCIKSCQ